MSFYNNRTPEEATEEFLQRMRKDTGVSQRFLDSARPLIRRVFIEVPVERRPGCLASLRRAFFRQAEIESLVSEAKAELDGARTELIQKQKQLTATNGLFGAKDKTRLN